MQGTVSLKRPLRTGKYKVQTGEVACVVRSAHSSHRRHRDRDRDRDSSLWTRVALASVYHSKSSRSCNNGMQYTVGARPTRTNADGNRRRARAVVRRAARRLSQPAPSLTRPIRLSSSSRHGGDRQRTVLRYTRHGLVAMRCDRRLSPASRLRALAQVSRVAREGDS